MDTCFTDALVQMNRLVMITWTLIYNHTAEELFDQHTHVVVSLIRFRLLYQSGFCMELFPLEVSFHPLALIVVFLCQ